MSNTDTKIEVGQVWRFQDGSLDKVTATDGRIVVTDEIEGPDGGAIRSSGQDQSWGVSLFLTTHTRVEPAPAPAPAETSQHPADLKPRTGKDPMHLIPWAVVPAHLLPDAAMGEAAECAGRWPDGDTFEVPPETSGPMFQFALALLTYAVHTAGWGPIARAFGYGAAKYARDNWRSFTWDKSAEDSYFGAICRHLTAISQGETHAPDSQVEHAGHVGAGALIWAWHLTYGAKRAAAEPPKVVEPTPEPAPSRPRVGDRVRVTGGRWTWLTMGRGRVVEDDGTGLPFRVRLENGNEIWCAVGEIEIEAIP